MPTLWCHTGPWAVNAAQSSLQHECFWKPRSPKGLGNTHPLCKKDKKQDQKHGIDPEAGLREEPWAPQGGDIHSLITWVSQRGQGWQANPLPFGVWKPHSALAGACVLSEGRCPNCFFQNTSLLWGHKQQGAEGAEAFLLYMTNIRVFSSLVHHHHPWQETNWPGQGLTTSRHPSQSLFIYRTLNNHCVSHPPLKSGLSSQIPWAVENRQLSEVACYHCQVPPCLCQPLGQRVSGSPAVLGRLGTSDQWDLLFRPSPNSAMSQKSNCWKESRLLHLWVCKTASIKLVSSQKS